MTTPWKRLLPSSHQVIANLTWETKLGMGHLIKLFLQACPHTTTQQSLSTGLTRLTWRSWLRWKTISVGLKKIFLLCFFARCAHRGHQTPGVGFNRVGFLPSRTRHQHHISSVIIKTQEWHHILVFFQGQCGSCAAFATVAILETWWVIAPGAQVCQTR